MMITIGRMQVLFTLAQGEKIETTEEHLSVAYHAYIEGLFLGSFYTEKEAAKAIYVEREGFSAFYG